MYPMKLLAIKVYSKAFFKTLDKGEGGVTISLEKVVKPHPAMG